MSTSRPNYSIATTPSGRVRYSALATGNVSGMPVGYRRPTALGPEPG